MDFFTFYATTGAVKCNHQLVVATTGAFTLTSVIDQKLLIIICLILPSSSATQAETRFLSVASPAWPPLRCGGQGRAIAANPASI